VAVRVGRSQEVLGEGEQTLSVGGFLAAAGYRAGNGRDRAILPAAVNPGNPLE
jgi:hypothetical protein